MERIHHLSHSPHKKHTSEISSALFSGDPQELDICTFLGKDRRYSRLYFSPKHFPPPPVTEGGLIGSAINDLKAWKELKFKLERAAFNSGNPIISNGPSKPKAQDRRFVCACKHRDKYGKGKMTKEETKCVESRDYRMVSLINDRRNNRPRGKTLPRRRSGFDFVSSPNCGFRFTIKWDKWDFYINLTHNSGSMVHLGHPRSFEPLDAAYPTRLISADEKVTAKAAVECSNNNGCGRNFLHAKISHYLERMKIAYLTRKKNTTSDNITAMLDSFRESDEVKYTILSDVPADDLAMFEDSKRHNSEETEITCTTKTGWSASSAIVNRGPAEDERLHQFRDRAAEERQARSMHKDQILFISVAWIVLPVFRFFMLCPHSICCDVTSHSNKEGYHLLTFSTKTSLGKQVIFMWVWIRNQQRFSFRWVFQFAIKELIPKWIRDRVEFIMKDGDPQQRNKILIALKNVFTRAVEGTCGFHVVSLGYKKHGPSSNSVEPRYKTRFELFVSKVQKWIYSWMSQGYCEDEDEFAISKHLLLQFVASDEVTQMCCGNLNVQAHIIRFLQTKVFVYENLFLWYQRKHIFTLFVAHATGHEGTNHGMKDHSVTLSATMGMDSAAKALNVQQDLKAAELNAIVERDFTHKNKNFSSLPTARYTHQRAEGIIKQIHDRKNLYSARRVGDRCFQVYYIGDMADVLRAELNTCKDLSGEVPVPLFLRIRTITVDDHNIMRCSCSSFESCGLFCTHCVVVAEAVFASQDKTFYGFTHHDCDMIYHSAYLHLAYRDTTPFQITRAYNCIAKGEKSRTEVENKDT